MAKQCRTKKCTRDARALGVCESCYSVIRRAVERGEITWDQAEKRGLVLRVRNPSPIKSVLKEIING